MNYLSTSEVQYVELDIMKQFDEFCERNNFHYLLAYGSLIGAVRHHGFIPWDDDIDVILPRSEYNELIQYYKEGNKIGDLDLLYFDDSNDFNLPYAKLCNSKTIAKPESNRTIHGIWIDIFPVDKITENSDEAEKFQKQMFFLRRVINSYDTDFIHRKFDKKTPSRFIVSIIGRIIGIKRIIKLQQGLVQKYNNTNSNNLCAMAWQSVPGGIFTIEEFYDFIKVPFEQYEFRIPRSYDKYLRSIYGNYMEMPPENKRKTHGLKAYYKNQETQKV